MLFIFGLVLSYLLILLLLFGSKEKRIIKLSFAIFVGLIAAWAYFRMLSVGGTPEDNLLFFRLSLMVITFSMPAFLLFTATIARVSRLSLYTATLTAFVISLLQLTDISVQRISTQNFSLDVAEFGVGYILFSCFLSVGYVFSLIVLKKRSTNYKISNKVFRVVATAAIISICLGLTPDLLFDSGNTISVLAEFPVFVIAMTVVTYNILKLGFFSLGSFWKSVFVRSLAIHTFLFLGTLSVLVVLDWLGVVNITLNSFKVLIPLLFSASLMISYRVINSTLSTKRKVELFEEIGSTQLRGLSDLRIVIEEIGAALSSSYVKLVKRGKVESGLPLSNIDTISFKITVRQANDYHVEFGPKTDGLDYSDVEIKLVKITVMQLERELAVIVQRELNTTLRKEFKSQLDTFVSKNTELETKNRDKDDFVSIASHQLRTPLAVASLNNKMLSDGLYGYVDKDQRRVMQSTQDNIEKMSQIIEELLETSRISDGSFKVSKQTFTIGEVIDEEILRHKHAAEKKHIEIKRNVNNKQKINADKTKISEIVSNLLSNAIYYSNDNSEVLVSLSSSEGSVVLKVTDNGIGVSEADKAKLFTRFGRGENASKSRPDGMGLGLFLAKKTVEAHGGELIFESKLNKGSTFGFSLPAN